MFGYVCQRTNGQNQVHYGRPSRSPFGTTTVVKGNLRKFYWNTVVERLFVHRARGLFLSVYGDDINLAAKTENIEPTWTSLMRDVDLGEPTSFLDHVNLGCTQTECQTSQGIETNYRDVFESRISAGVKEKLQTRATGKLDAETISSWSYDMEGHAKTCVARCCELTKRRLNNNTKSQHRAWMTVD